MGIKIDIKMEPGTVLSFKGEKIVILDVSYDYYRGIATYHGISGEGYYCIFHKHLATKEFWCSHQYDLLKAMAAVR